MSRAAGGCVMGMVTCSSREEARRLARAVLERKLAACVNVLAGAESHYWWQGKIERSRECVLMIKTTRAKIKEVTTVIGSAHSYDTPEIVFLPIAAGEKRYLNWVRRSVAGLAVGLACLTGAMPVRAERIDELVRQLGHAEEEMRADAAGQLARIGGPRVEKLFREMLASPNPERRQMAVVGLLQVSDADADLRLVRERLKDSNAMVRWSAAVALGSSGRAEAVAWLEATAKDDASESVREGAAEALARLRSGIVWLHSLPEGLREARRLQKPLLLYFRVPGSEPCRRYEEGVLADASVVNAAQEFVCVRIDAAQDVTETRRYDVRGAPTVLALDAEGNEMTRVSGVVEAQTLLGKLAEARRGRLSYRAARRLALQNPQDVTANWRVAQTHLEEGREDLAEPFLRNVIAHDPHNRQGYTDDAMFALGYCLGKRGAYAQAVVCLEKLLQDWPGFKDADKALYMLGLSELAQGRRQPGRAALEQLRERFPNSRTIPSAELALKKLDADLAGDEHKK
jgi:periplasmic divalent cation tolerance protein